ncbi:hypothetical protein A2U01_0039175, partial [Trifolium medium]|nr:hypothetical protein [Trifolium medium]
FFSDYTNLKILVNSSFVVDFGRNYNWLLVMRYRLDGNKSLDNDVVHYVVLYPFSF